MPAGQELRDALAENAMQQLKSGVKPALVNQIARFYNESYGRDTGEQKMRQTPQRKLRDRLNATILEGLRDEPDDASWFGVALTWLKSQFSMDDDCPFSDEDKEAMNELARAMAGKPNRELLDGDDYTSYGR